MAEHTPDQNLDTMESDARKRQLIELVNRRINEASQRPFIVSIMGQTGVGKSSLINAVFGTNLKVDSVRPCTKEIERVVTQDGTGKDLWFYDLPGIGESLEADAAYLSQYRQQLLDSDVVLWAIHGDSRSFAHDVSSLQSILSDFNTAQQACLVRKITFVLTKVDLLTPPPWILAKSGETGFFAPGPTTKKTLALKCGYCEEAFLVPHQKLLVAQTYNEAGFNISDDCLSFDEHTVYYRGLLTEERVSELTARFPQHSSVFDRLLDNHRVIPCSSRFRYNLAQLMVVIVNKLGLEAVGRFARYVSKDEMNAIRVSDAKELCNVIIFDAASQARVFDLTQHDI